MRNLSVAAIALGVVSLGALGCGDEACSGAECEKAPALEFFEGTAVSPDPVPYTSGMDVTVEGIYGGIETQEGPAGEVSVVFVPFNQREKSKEDLALEEMEKNLETSFEVSENLILVSTGREGATKGLGVNITVFLPPEFDGALVLRNQSDGPPDPYWTSIDVLGAGNARSFDVSNENDGFCFLSSDGSAVSTRARCGPIHATGVSDHIDLAATGPYGDVNVIFRSVAGEEAGGSVTTEEDDVELHFPDGSNFFVDAEVVGNGLIQLSTIDSSSCTTEGDDRDRKSVV